MPICIHCRLPLATLYTTYSRADDRSLGKGVRLTQCPRCKRFADKYVEHDFVVLFIDLVLIKPQVYRHLLFNRLGGASGANAGKSSASKVKRYGDWDPSIIRLGILLLLFDVYLTWARIEKMSSMGAEISALSLPPASSMAINTTDALTSLTTSPVSAAGNYFLASQSILNQYLFFLLLCALETVTFHGIVRLLCTSGWLSRPQRVGTTMGEQSYREYARSTRESATTSARSSRPPSRIHSTRPSTEEIHTPPTTFSAPPSPVIPSSIPATATSAASTSLPIPTTTATFLPRSVTSLPPSTSSFTSSHHTTQPPPAPPEPTVTTISTALLVSSLPNLFPILMVIWQYDLPSSASAVSWAVIVNNIAALEILLDCGVVKAGGVVCAAAIGRWAMGETMLGFVGLGEGVVGSLARMTAVEGGVGILRLFGG